MISNSEFLYLVYIIMRNRKNEENDNNIKSNNKKLNYNDVVI